MLYTNLLQTLFLGSLCVTTAVASPAPHKSHRTRTSTAKALPTVPMIPVVTKSRSGGTSDDVPLRILAIGDSITYGFNELPGNSYRRFLQCKISTAGQAVTYIGTTTNGDWDNSANDGYVSQEIDAISASASWILDQSPKPNLVLLHAGSNDILHTVDISTAPARLGSLIDKIIDDTDGASVLVAQIIGLGEGYEEFNAAVKTYNKAIPGIVASRVAAGKNVKVVSMAAVTAADLVDGIHPVAAGYAKMADAWFDALDGLKISNVSGAYTDLGSTAVPSTGNCADLKA